MALKFLNDGYFAGKVGIGTESPYNKTHITTSVDGDGLLLDYAGSNNKYVGVFFKIDNNTSDAYKKGALVWERTGSYNEGRFHFLLNNDDNASNVDLTDSKVTILSTGNVGIGTTAPQTILHLKSGGSPSLRIQDSDGTDQYATINHNNGSNQYIARNNTSNGQHIWYGQTATSSFNERMRIDSSGNVGIGTTSPDDKLHVNQGSAAFRGITIEGTSPALYLKDTQATNAYHIGSNGNYLYFLEDSNQSGGYNNIMAFWDPSNNFIFSLGNVGIGTSTPSQKLHVAGNARVTGAYYDSNNSPGTANQVLVSTVTGTDWIDGSAIPGVPGGSGTLNTIPLWTPDGNTLGNSIITQPTSAEVSVGGKLKVSSTVAGYGSTKIQTGGFGDSQSGINILNSTTGYGYILFGDGSGADLYKGQITYKHGDDFMAFNTNGSERIRVDSIGRVGIGTNSPSHKLTINASNDTTALGIDFPSAHFDFSANSTSGYTSNFRINDVGMDIGHDSTARSLNLQTGDQDRLTILGNGNVGIGTTNPGSLLHVEGNRTTACFQVNQTGAGVIANFKQGGSSKVLIDNAGNVGIGTTSPNRSLHVIGQVAIDNSTSPSGGLLVSPDGTSNKVYSRTGNATSSAHPLDFISGSSTSMRIAANGNVGIGTTSPGTKLDVNGTGNFTGLVSGITPVNAANFVTKAYVDGSGGGTGPFLPLAGGTLSGNLTMDDSDVVFKHTDGFNYYRVGVGTNANFEIYNTNYGRTDLLITQSTGDATFVGDISAVNANITTTMDVGSFIYVGGNNSIFAENNLRFKSSGAAYIDHNTAGQSINFRTSVSSSLDTTPLSLTGANATFAGDVIVSGGDLTINSTGNAILNVNGTANSFVEKDTGTDLYFANNVSDKDIIFRVKDDTTNVIALTIDGSEGGDSTFAAQAFSAATSSGDASSTLTTKGYVDGLITGATIYRGTWDPDKTQNSGYGVPDLSGVTQTSGYYYICSAVGIAEPNGSGCEPNSWDVGDWVIWNDDIVDCAGTGTGGWQKIDNSSVLSGVGTGQTVALWEGASSVTDSETLGNAPITVNGNDVKITSAGDTNLILQSANPGSTSLDFYEGTDEKAHITFDTVNNVLTMGRAAGGLSIDNSGNSTFAGNVTATSGIFSDVATLETKLNGNDSALNFTTASGDTFRIGLKDSDDTFRIAKSDASLATNTYLTINSSGNATFAGTVTATTFLGNSTTQTAGDNSTKIATTAYADAAAAAVPIGNYLPLTAGSGFPLTGKLYAQDDIYISGEHVVKNIDTNLYLDSASGYNVLLRPGGSEKVRIQSNGNVGIGTTSPTGILGIARPSNVAYDGTNDSGQDTIGASVTITNTNTTVNSFAQINMQVSASSNRAVGRIVTIARGNASSDMAFVTESFGVRAEKMRIDQTGNVGIGTTSPGYKLDVSGTGQITSRIISTDNSGARFDLHSSGGGRYSQQALANGDFFMYDETSGHPIQRYFDGASGAWAWYTVGTERMRIDSSGNVMIGNTGASAKLDIRQDTGYALRTENASGYTFRVEADTGNIEAAGSIQMADDTDTASATKVGTMRYRTGTEYVEVTGTELITNGDFTTDTGWTKGAGWTIANGVASLTAQGASSSLGSTVMTVTSGNIYKVVIDVISTSTGFRLYDTLGVVAYGLSEGKNIFYRTVTSSSYQVTPLGLSGASGSIESVSVMEVTAEDASYADMCMQTGASTYEWVNIVRNTY